MIFTCLYRCFPCCDWPCSSQVVPSDASVCPLWSLSVEKKTPKCNSETQLSQITEVTGVVTVKGSLFLTELNGRSVLKTLRCLQSCTVPRQGSRHRKHWLHRINGSHFMGISWDFSPQRWMLRPLVLRVSIQILRPKQCTGTTWPNVQAHRNIWTWEMTKRFHFYLVHIILCTFDRGQKPCNCKSVSLDIWFWLAWLVSHVPGPCVKKRGRRGKKRRKRGTGNRRTSTQGAVDPSQVRAIHQDWRSLSDLQRDTWSRLNDRQMVRWSDG